MIGSIVVKYSGGDLQGDLNETIFSYSYEDKLNSSNNSNNSNNTNNTANSNTTDNSNNSNNSNNSDNTEDTSNIISSSIKVLNPRYYIFDKEEDERPKDITLDSLSNYSEDKDILIIFNSNIDLKINTNSVTFTNDKITEIKRINYIEIFGKEKNNILIQLRYLDKIVIVMTKYIFINMISHLLCFGNSGTKNYNKDKCKIDENLSQLDLQSRIWIDSFIENELFDSDGQSITDIKIQLKQLIDESDYIDYLSNLLNEFPGN